MKNKFVSLTVLAAVGLLAACTAIQTDTSDPKAGMFPAATNSFLFEGNIPVGNPDSPVSLSGAPTVAAVFRTLPDAPSLTPSPTGISVTSTLPSEPTETPTSPPGLYTAAIYAESLNPNWIVQKGSSVSFNLKSSGDVYRGHAAISFTPRKRGDSNLIITVSDQTPVEYRRDQVTKLSFWLYSPKTVLYLDQFFVTFLGSKYIPYWSADDQKVSNYLSVSHQISLEELGFDRAVPANTWVKVEIDLDKVRALAPEYTYITGISFKNATDPNHMLLIDDINLTLLGKPPKAPTPEITATVQSK